MTTTSDSPDRFSETERQFLRSQSLGRLATLTSSGDPVVVPVAFTVEPDDSIRVSGFALTESAKWRNLGRDPRFSLVADEGIGTDARGVMLRGTAERIESGETAPMLLLRATRVVSWGVDSRPFSRVARDIAAP